MFYLIKGYSTFSNWFCLTNHKIIGMLYLLFGLWVAFLATFMSVLIRRELGASSDQVVTDSYLWYDVFLTGHVVLVFTIIMYYISIKYDIYRYKYLLISIVSIILCCKYCNFVFDGYVYAYSYDEDYCEIFYLSEPAKGSIDYSYLNKHNIYMNDKISTRRYRIEITRGDKYQLDTLFITNPMYYKDFLYNHNLEMQHMYWFEKILLNTISGYQYASTHMNEEEVVIRLLDRIYCARIIILTRMFTGMSLGVGLFLSGCGHE